MGVVACVGSTGDVESERSDIAAQIGTPSPPPPTCPTARPPINPAMCNPQEPAPPPPPINGKCEVELRVTSIAFSKGQGWFEGRAEASADFSAVDQTTGDSVLARWPDSGWVKMDLGKEQTTSVALGTYEVEKGKHRSVYVCATYREYDDLSADDVGSDCEMVKLSCPQPEAKVPLAADLCQGGNCSTLRGKMTSNLEVETADADGDCVANADDYTPDPCDEALKGQLCRGSLVYFSYENGVGDDIAQSLGTDLTPAMTGYDRVVLLIDDDQIGPYNLNPAALALADVKMTPTEQNFFAALKDLTARGCDIDVWMFAHGSPDWDAHSDNSAYVNGGWVSTLADEAGDVDPRLTTKSLLAHTAPDVSGTPSVPVRMAYGTPCFYQLWNDPWLTVGAKVTAGAVDIDFTPNFYDNFSMSWNAGARYGAALASEYDTAKEALAFAYIQTVGALPPWGCIGSGNTVLDRNACAANFFIDSDFEPMWKGQHLQDGPDDAKYGIGGPAWDLAGIPYDPAFSGAVNMRASSAKVLLGDPTITKTTRLTWK